MYQEPAGQELAGHKLHYKVARSAYEVFMEEQTIPIYRGIGIYDVRQLPLATWNRTGGRGTFVQLDGQAGLWGMHVVEVPARGTLNSEHHMYEEMFLIIEGRGSTEVWREGSSRKRTFEWQPGSHFAVPLNTWHRLVNATSAPALVLVATSAPRVMELFPSRSFIFDNPLQFPDRYDESDGYFKPRDELEPDPESGRAILRSNLLPDIIHCYLPLDNHRAPGYRRMAVRMAGNVFFNVSGFIAEYPSGRYSKAHYHQAGAVLICLSGKGYTYNWPVGLGPRPWEVGEGHLVKRQDYIPGGMVAAAPGGGDWFHQHFSVGKDLLRVRAITAGLQLAEQGGQDKASTGVEIGQGGCALGYREEDPQIRKIYKEALEKEGVELQMPESLYR
ncbi:MAG: cupin domain-containing protein [Chloroflexi bacterium]|nr:cupin domain-containing protein [Chloroflexota bacterium]